MIKAMIDLRNLDRLRLLSKQSVREVCGIRPRTYSRAGSRSRDRIRSGNGFSDSMSFCSFFTTRAGRGSCAAGITGCPSISRRAIGMLVGTVVDFLEEIDFIGSR